jgi:hypothetical protein
MDMIWPKQYFSDKREQEINEINQWEANVTNSIATESGAILDHDAMNAEIYAYAGGDVHLDPIYPSLVFNNFGQLVIPGWITINDLTVSFYRNGLVRVRMSPYVSRPQYLRCKFTLKDAQQTLLVSEIFPRDFDFHHIHETYLPDQETSVRDDRCPPALQYAAWINADIAAITP